MSWYDTDDFDYAYFRMVWDDPPWQGADAPAGAIPELLLDSLQQLADEYQRMFDELAEHARGMAVDDIKPALANASAAVGNTLTERELTRYATLLSKGIRVEVQLEL